MIQSKLTTFSFGFRLEQTSQSEGSEAARNLVLLMASLSFCGHTQLKPSSSTSPSTFLFQMENFQMPEPENNGKWPHHLITFCSNFIQSLTYVRTVGIWNPTIQNSESFEIWPFCRLYFKWSALQRVGLWLKLWSQVFKIGQFCRDFQWFLKKWQLFVSILNGLDSGFQIPFKIKTIFRPTSFWTFKIQTSLDFRSPFFRWEAIFGDHQKGKALKALML